MSGIFKLNREVQFEFILGPDWAGETIGNMDIVLTRPSGVATYTNGGATSIIPPTSTTQGVIFYTWTPDVVGLWTVDLMKGAGDAAVSLHRADVWVIDIPVTEWDNCVRTPPIMYGAFENWRMKHQILGTDWDAAAFGALTSASMAFYTYGLDICDAGSKVFFTMKGTTYSELVRLDLSTPYDLSTATYHSQGPIGTEGGFTNNNIKISPNGTELFYFVVTGGSKALHSFDFDTAWDPTVINAASKQTYTATYDLVMTTCSTIGNDFFSYNNTGPNSPGKIIHHHNPTDPWSASNFAASGDTFTIGGIAPMSEATIGHGATPEPYSLASSDDGEFHYIMCNYNTYLIPDACFVFRTPTPWDLTTAYFLDITTDPAMPEPGFLGMWGKVGERCKQFWVREFVGDNDFYVLNFGSSVQTAICQYHLGTEGFFKRENLQGDEFNDKTGGATVTSSDFSQIHGLWMGDDYLYLTASNSIYQFQFNVSGSYDILDMNYIQSHNVGIVSTGIFFNNDGTKMILGGSTVLYGYTLSTAWDISTAVLDSTTSTPPINTNIAGAISPDGGTYFTMDSDTITEITMSTGWDVSTQSVSTGYTFDISSLKNEPPDTNVRRWSGTGFPIVSAASFNDDGTKLAVVYGYNTVDPDINGDCIYIIDLTAPYSLAGTPTITNASDPYDMFGTKGINTKSLWWRSAEATFLSTHRESHPNSELCVHQIVTAI